MTAVVIPDMRRRLIVQAADRAYDAIRCEVGDSYEVAAVLRRLAHECWMDGFAEGRDTPKESPE